MTNEFSIPSQYDRIIDVCQFVVAGAEQVGFSTDDLFKIELACDEACTNVIEHAYDGDEIGQIRVKWQFVDNAFTITISDDGQPFNPQDVPQPNLTASPDDVNNLKVGGLGIHFMRSLMDEVHFFFEGNQGNRLVMVKYMTDHAKQ